MSVQVELLEKAKFKNIIVYLGTGSGKTFIAVMLIKHMRDELCMKKVVFLVNNVELLEQQAQVIRDCTGLPTGSYCGASGVDDWGKDRWERELRINSVLVFIHQVFLNALAHGFIPFSSLALLVMDECHHAVKNHPYSKIMTEWYHRAKKRGDSVPRVLGLSASIVVKAVKKEKFRQEKVKLEKMMDAEVETADGISIEHFVESASERIVRYEKRDILVVEDKIADVIVATKMELLKLRGLEMKRINQSENDMNSKTSSSESLQKDFKFFNNDILGNISSLLELGVYSLVAVERSLMEDIERKCERIDTAWYSDDVRTAMAREAKTCLGTCVRMAKSQMLGFEGSEQEKIIRFTSRKALKLKEIIEKKGFAKETREEVDMRCIIFVERRLITLALQHLIWKLNLPTVTDVGYCHSSNANRNVKDPREREEVVSAKHRMKETLRKFRTGAVNLLISTSVVEEGIDVPSCNLVVKYDFPQTYRSYIQSKGRARKRGSQYILMVEEGDKEKETKYNEWLGVYKMSMEECQKVEGVDEDEREDFYSTSVARVSGTQAVMLLHQYLQKIPVDRFTRLTPSWSFSFKEASRNSNQVFLLIILLSLRSDNVVSVKTVFWSWASILLALWLRGHGAAAPQDTSPHPCGGQGEVEEGVGQEVSSITSC
jgi:endoribonuclease Dicer